MRYTNLQPILAAVILSALVACGGEEESKPGSGPIVTSPSPPPTQTASQYPPAPFGLESGEQFQLVGWIMVDGEMTSQRSDEVSFAWGLDPDTYRLTLPEIDDGRLIYTFPDNQNAFTIVKPDGAEADVAASVITGRLFAMRFESIGQLHVYHRSDGSEVGTLLFGIETPLANIPSQGRRIFRFDQSGRPFDIEIDFATGIVTGTVAIAYTDAWGPYEPKFMEIFNGRYDRTTGEITASFALDETEIEGVLNGRFMGPRSDELALAVSGPVFDPYTNQYTRQWFVQPGIYCAEC